jgi:hypothetical protein
MSEPTEARTAREKLDAVNAIRVQVVALRDDPDEAVALRGAFDDLLVPIDSIRRDMAQRIDLLSRQT